MAEEDIYAQIQELLDTEKALRSKVEQGTLNPEDERAQLTTVEQTLDQCWDLLRQRRARRDAGLPDDDVPISSRSQVEGYLQ